MNVFVTMGTAENIVCAIDRHLGDPRVARAAQAFVRPCLDIDTDELFQQFGCTFDDDYDDDDDVVATRIDSAGGGSANFAAFTVTRMLLVRWHGTWYMFLVNCSTSVSLCPISWFHGSAEERLAALKGIATELVNREIAHEAWPFVNTYIE
jgi:hypothetical protein